MSEELARVRLRGIYALAAGIILLVGVPLVESVSLASAGYLAAVDAVARTGNFVLLVAWISRNAGADGAFHLFEVVPFLLAFTLPRTLSRLMWPEGARAGQVVTLVGRVGFACYAVALVVGVLTSKTAAATFATATTSAQQQAAAAGFASAFGIQNLIANVVGGLLVAVCAALVSVRSLKSPVLPSVVGFLGMLVAAFLVVTALQFAFGLQQVETSLSALSFAALALWLGAIGLVLIRLRALPQQGASVRPAAPVPDPKPDAVPPARQ
ncbi:MAG TPA: hypothetical protein VGS80_10465 [Ktedonobacterales bacterium]|nr:hypothetical protein [Ktedonobacterales bacterium]